MPMAMVNPTAPASAMACQRLREGCPRQTQQKRINPQVAMAPPNQTRIDELEIANGEPEVTQVLGDEDPGHADDENDRAAEHHPGGGGEQQGTPEA